jgi:hypothetical protein
LIQPTGDQLRVSNLVAGTYDFTLHVTDSNGQSDDATVNIQVLNQEESDSESTWDMSFH